MKGGVKKIANILMYMHGKSPATRRLEESRNHPQLISEMSSHALLEVLRGGRSL